MGDRSRRVRLWLFAVAALTLGCVSVAAVHAAPFADYHPAPVFDGASATAFYLPMRDGVRLAVKLYRPTQGGRIAPGRFPVIWHATLDIGDSRPGAHPIPTGVRFGTEKAADDPAWESARDLSSLTRHGYAVAIVARRGSGASFGRRRGYEDLTEAQDSYEVTEWLAAQPWSSGAVGVYGCSNTGEAAMHVLTVRPPHLKAVWAGCFSFNRYDGFTRGGVIANWGAGPQRTLAEDLKATPVDADADRALVAQAAEEHQGSTYLLDLMKGMPYRDSWSPLTMSRFWPEASVSSYLDQMRQSGAALYIQGGWRDDFRGQGLIAFANYLPGRRYIVIGDWTHCSNAGFDLRSEQLRFFDRYLKGIDTGIEGSPPIHYAVVDAPPGQTWRAADRWPVAGEQARTLYLTGGGDLAPRPAGPSAERSLQVRYDVTCPGAVDDPRMAVLLQPCPPAQGTVSWTGPALTRDTTLTGFPVIALKVASNQPDARVFAYLADVSPDGGVHAFTDARLDLKLRKATTPPWDNLGLPWHPSTQADAAPMPVDGFAQVRIAFLPVAYVLKAGHRLQLTLAGADYRERARPQAATPPVLRFGEGGPDGSTLTLPVVAGAAASETPAS